MSGDRVVALATVLHTDGEWEIRARLLALNADDEVIYADKFDSTDGTPIPTWIPEAAREPTWIPEAAQLREQYAAARAKRSASEPTDEEAEEAAMTDAVEEFEPVVRKP